MKETQALDSLKGIGEKTKQIFQKAGISDVGDLLHYFPRTYETFGDVTEISELKEGQTAAVYAWLERDLSVNRIHALQMTKGVLRDKSGAVDVVWYHMPYLKNTLKRGAHLVFRGKLTMKKKHLTMEQPSVYEPAEYQALRSVLQPVYPLCEGLTNNMLQKAMHQVMADEELTREYLPEELLSSFSLEDQYVQGNAVFAFL